MRYARQARRVLGLVLIGLGSVVLFIGNGTIAIWLAARKVRRTLGLVLIVLGGVLFFIGDATKALWSAVRKAWKSPRG